MSDDQLKAFSLDSTEKLSADKIQEYDIDTNLVETFLSICSYYGKVGQEDTVTGEIKYSYSDFWVELNGLVGGLPETISTESRERLTQLRLLNDVSYQLYENAKGTTPYCVKTVAVLNSWGKMRSWGCHMVHHALYQKQNYSYAGVIEALSGAPYDVKFISFDDIRANADILNDIDVVINVGDGDTAHTGGYEWEDPQIVDCLLYTSDAADE